MLSRDAIGSIDQLQDELGKQLYVADRSLATAIFLSLKLRKPLFLEGEAGVGKTEVAKVLAAVLGAPLIRLQCYEGLDLQSAVYEWNYARQMLYLRAGEAAGGLDRDAALKDLFGPEFLLERPLLRAIRFEGPGPAVLLIDELDRADEEFEAYLLEVLSDYQVSIPEVGTIRSKEPPVAVISSNRTREVHDALKRRCLYHWIDYPSLDKELQIVLAKAPEAPERLAREVVEFVQALRSEDLYKRPGVAETLDWVAALVALEQRALAEDIVQETLGVLLKYQDDIERVRDGRVPRILSQLAGSNA